jgi:hypothetical protein
VVKAEPSEDDTAGALDAARVADTGSDTGQPRASTETPVFARAPEGALRPVAQKQAVGQLRKPAMFAKKPALLRPASSGVARPRAPLPVPFKPTVERNPYLR